MLLSWLAISKFLLLNRLEEGRVRKYTTFFDFTVKRYLVQD